MSICAGINKWSSKDELQENRCMCVCVYVCAGCLLCNRPQMYTVHIQDEEMWLTSASEMIVFTKQGAKQPYAAYSTAIQIHLQSINNATV